MRYESPAGWIQNLGVQGHVQLIWSRAGSERSNHYHLTDSHTLYVVSGLMEYWERRVGGSEIEHASIGPGESIYTGPMVEHTTRFPVDTLLVSVSARDRSHENHEADVVRVASLAPPSDRDLASMVLLRAGLEDLAKRALDLDVRPGTIEADVTKLLNDAESGSERWSLLFETKHAIRRWRKPINGPEDFRAEARRLLG